MLDTILQAVVITGTLLGGIAFLCLALISWKDRPK